MTILLTAEVYVGDYWFENQGVYIERHHQAIISREVWDRVQFRFLGATVELKEVAA